MQEKLEVESMENVGTVYLQEYALECHWGIRKLPKAFKLREAGDSRDFQELLDSEDYKLLKQSSKFPRATQWFSRYKRWLFHNRSGHLKKSISRSSCQWPKTHWTEILNCLNTHRFVHRFKALTAMTLRKVSECTHAIFFVHLTDNFFH